MENNKVDEPRISPPPQVTQPDEDTLTPTPVRKTSESITMSFPDAIKAIIAGSKVRRLDWTTPSDHGLLKNGWLSIHTKGKYHTWSVSDGDLEAIDWIIVKEVD